MELAAKLSDAGLPEARAVSALLQPLPEGGESGCLVVGWKLSEP